MTKGVTSYWLVAGINSDRVEKMGKLHMPRASDLLFHYGGAASENVQGLEAKSLKVNGSQTRTCGRGDSGGMDQGQLRRRRSWWDIGKSGRFIQVKLQPRDRITGAVLHNAISGLHNKSKGVNSKAEGRAVRPL